MSQTRQDPDRNRSVGAYSIGEGGGRRRAGWLVPLLVLLGLILLGLILWALLGHRGTSTGTAAPAASNQASAGASASAAASASPPATTGGGTGAGTATGQLTAGGTAVLPLSDPSATLARYAGQTAVAKSVRVQSVPADEGFWLGTSESDRVWVQMTGTGGESGFKVRPGDTVSFDTGRVVPTPSGFADRVGVTAAEGAGQLAAQRQHIEVAKSDVRLSQ